MKIFTKLSELFTTYRQINNIDKLAQYFAERLELKDIVYIGDFQSIKIINTDQQKFNIKNISASKLSKLYPEDFSHKIIVSNLDEVDLKIDNSKLKELSHISPFVILTSKITTNTNSGKTIEEFQTKVEKSGINKGLVGYDYKNKEQLVYISGKYANPNIDNQNIDSKKFKKLRVLAIMTLFNESDVIESVINHLLAQDVDIYVIDNWSEDGSFEIVEDLIKKNKGRITLERFPKEGPDRYYEWKKLLGRVEEVAAESNYDWCIHHDSDEVRKSPWNGVSISDAINAIDAMGFSAIDHTVLNFKPVEDTFKKGDDVEKSIEYFEINTHPGYFLQNKGWKNIKGIKVDLQFTGGHDATFEGRKVFPLKFLLKHYSIRSNEQAHKKIFKNRLPRISEREKSFNDHYANMEKQQDFLSKKEDLYCFDPQGFDYEYLLPRISGVGFKED